MSSEVEMTRPTFESMRAEAYKLLGDAAECLRGDWPLAGEQRRAIVRARHAIIRAKEELNRAAGP